MATLTIRNLPDDVHDRLRVRAAENGRSMEAEVRDVLAKAYTPDPRPQDRADFLKRVRQLQETFQPYRRPDESLVDELIAERRWEAAREAAESEGLPRPPSALVRDG